MKKLIEEIALALEGVYAMGHSDGVANHNRGQFTTTCLRELSKITITRIGKAYAEGMKLPREVGRMHIARLSPEARGKVIASPARAAWIEDMISRFGVDQFIALREEEK